MESWPLGRNAGLAGPHSVAPSGSCRLQGSRQHVCLCVCLQPLETLSSLHLPQSSSTLPLPRLDRWPLFAAGMGYISGWGIGGATGQEGEHMGEPVGASQPQVPSLSLILPFQSWVHPEHPTLSLQPCSPLGCGSCPGPICTGQEGIDVVPDSGLGSQ